MCHEIVIWWLHSKHVPALIISVVTKSDCRLVSVLQILHGTRCCETVKLNLKKERKETCRWEKCKFFCSTFGTLHANSSSKLRVYYWFGWIKGPKNILLLAVCSDQRVSMIYLMAFGLCIVHIRFIIVRIQNFGPNNRWYRMIERWDGRAF